MKKKSIIYSDLSKKHLENLKELYVQKKIELNGVFQLSKCNSFSLKFFISTKCLNA